MSEKTIPIPGRLKNVAIGGHVAGSEDIDAGGGKTQKQVNDETNNTLALHQSEISGLNSQNYVSVSSYSSLPATGSADTIYRVSSWDGNANSGEGAADVTKYTEYAWNGTAYIVVSVKTQIGEVFDISEYKAVGGTLAKFADLSAALDGGNNVPAGIRKGGMSVKFVQSSDNKYVQYRLMSDTFNTTVANWQGVDEEPVAGSNNVITSSGASDIILPYCSKLSTTNIISPIKLRDFIRDFKVLENRVTGYDYGILHVNCGLPADSDITYYLAVYRWPAGETPSYSNTTLVENFRFSEKPENGILKGSKVAFLLNWDAVTTPFGGTGFFLLFKSDCVWNQDYIFDKNTGLFTIFNIKDSIVEINNTLSEDKDKIVDLSEGEGFTVFSPGNQGYQSAAFCSDKRAGVASLIPNCNGKKFDIINVPFVSDSNELIVNLVIGQTDETGYSDNVFNSALNTQGNILCSKAISLGTTLKYTQIYLDNEIEVTKATLVVAVMTTDGSNHLYQVCQSNIENKTKINGLLISGTWYVYSGDPNPDAFGVYPKLISSFDIASKRFVQETLSNNLNIPYITKLSITNTLTPKQVQRFIVDFKVTDDRVAGYDYGILHINNGLPDNTDIKYYIAVYRWPTGQIPNYSNSVLVENFGYTEKPENGLINGTKVLLMVNWDEVSGVTWGSTGFFGIFMGDCIWNQDYIFCLDYGSAIVKAALDNVDNSIDVILPDKITAVVGDTIQLFHRGIVKTPDLKSYDIQVLCSKGKDYPRYFEYLPTSDDIGQTTLTVYVKNANRKILGQKSCTLITIGNPSSPQSSKKVLCIGDSLTSGGEWCAEAYRRLTGSGGTPSGKNLSNIDFCGSMTKDGAGFFGVGGWTWNSYITKNGNAYRFQITDVNTLTIDSQYTNNGNVFTIREVNVTDGTGNILCWVESLTPAPETSGTLTKQSGDGDATITFTSVAEDASNPLWDTANNKMSFIPYANRVSDGQIDIVYVLLGWNEVRVEPATTITKVKTFADTLHAEYPNAKMKILGLQINSLNGGMAANYGASGGYSDTWGIATQAFELNKAYQQFALQADYSSFVEFVDIASQFDTEYSMPAEQKLVNTRSDVYEIVGTNGVHPSARGYNQIADVVYRNISKEL